MKIIPLLCTLVVSSGALTAQNAVAAPVAKAPVAKAPQKPRMAWKPATKAQRVAVAASIRAQLEAFKRDDWAKAATFQSDGLRRNFGTLAQFRATIETNYPQFADYKSVAFDAARALGDQVQIQVRVTGKDGVKLRAIYLMRKEKGVFRVEGVQGGAVERFDPRREMSPGDAV